MAAEVAEGVKRRIEVKDVRASISVSEHFEGTEERNERSQMESKARPWATEARRPTVHIIAASIESSRVTKSAGFW